MPGTKNRIKQTAQACRAAVLESDLNVARDFITDVEATYCQGRHKPDKDMAWTEYFVDQRQITQEMLDRVKASLIRYEKGDENFLKTTT